MWISQQKLMYWCRYLFIFVLIEVFSVMQTHWKLLGKVKNYVDLLFLLLPSSESVIVLCFVVWYFMSILVLQSSWWGRESWLLCLVCLPGVSWLLCGSSSRCHGFVIVVFPDHTHYFHGFLNKSGCIDLSICVLIEVFSLLQTHWNYP